MPVKGLRPWQRPLAYGTAALAGFIVAVLVFNAPFWARQPEPGLLGLIAHRGVHQTYPREGLTNDTCTAERIEAPRHDYLENTLHSMQAAFDAGADVVELDVHPTTDGKLAVFHDWTIDCRTEGSGVTREQTMAVLKSLDIGHGYTADAGATFPFRGSGIGLMPSLDEVLDAFPDRHFLVNFKSNEAREGDLVADLVAGRPDWQERIWGAYGGDPPTYRLNDRLPGIHVWARRGLMDCLFGYAGLGWIGHVPEACRDTMVMVPINMAPFLWGWPELFVKRMADAGSGVILLGPYGAGDPGTAGIDALDQLAAVPAGFSGYLWTNRIELIGPELARQNPHRRASPPAL
ncbi:glycerophosphodiester phosphodiesterase family protein [Devosia enhydra]|uniref:glycerophosphodiester phosphodiesterase family protein n=1 Tax=Devosia enhydra TaxID=665118 RepID=UPI001FCD017D|nr:glycerophosphodiester phosphodiesterase family protein [Devosia enhydra]